MAAKKVANMSPAEISRYKKYTDHLNSVISGAIKAASKSKDDTVTVIYKKVDYENNPCCVINKVLIVQNNRTFGTITSSKDEQSGKYNIEYKPRRW